MVLKSIKKHIHVGIFILLAFTFAANAQTITSVVPDSATQGATDLSVYITLNPGDMEMPPPDAPLSSATIGSISSTSMTRNDTIVTAIFDIPFDEAAGAKDVTITFMSPPDKAEPLVFSITGGFTVTELLNTPPSLTAQPKSRSVLSGRSVTLSVSAYGSYPLSYQWQKDGADISDATNSTFTINSFAEGDIGSYRCVVSNDYGSATSEEAVLTLDERDYTNTYPIVGTNQTTFFNNTTNISEPSSGEAFYGQDAHYPGNAPNYVDNGDGTVTDMVTGLMWQQSFDHNGDGEINYDDNLTYNELIALVEGGVTFAGYDDWRLPTIKEMYSLILFSGRDISPEGTSTVGLTPFIDNETFEFAYGDLDAGERLIDMQCATTNVYVSNEVPETVFGVNFADGRIKGYGTKMGSEDKAFDYLLVRGNTSYGINNFVDNGDGTISDQATGLMWMQDDNGEGVLWQDALAYAEGKEFAGYSDWRLPDAKELQSIVDYTRSPATTNSAAIDPLFNCTQITNESGEADYPWYWSSTTHASMNSGGAAAYVAFGRSLGNMNGWIDIHGAGSQRSDPKTGNPDDFSEGRGPQGDAVRIYNYVRLVRDADTETGVGENENSQPQGFELGQNYPNPFNPSTTISFSLPSTSQVSLKIYNMIGQLQTTLVDEQLSQGHHEFQWQAVNMPSGTYFYTLESSSFSQTRRMILLK